MLLTSFINHSTFAVEVTKGTWGVAITMIPNWDRTMSQASRVETAGNAEKFLLTSLHYGHQHKTPHNNAAVHSPFHYLTLHIPSSMAISNTHTDYAAAGIATITAVAAVGNPRNIPGSKKVMLDVQVFVGSPSCESLLGALAYFNGSNMVFDHDSVALYLIYATVIVVFHCILTVFSSLIISSADCQIRRRSSCPSHSS